MGGSEFASGATPHRFPAGGRCAGPAIGGLELHRELGDDELVEADAFVGGFAFQGGVKTHGHADEELAAFARGGAFDQAGAIHRHGNEFLDFLEQNPELKEELHYLEISTFLRNKLFFLKRHNFIKIRKMK